MKMKLAAIVAIALAACRQQSAETDATIEKPVVPANGEAPATNIPMNDDGSANEVTTRAKPVDHKVLIEPKTPLDPKGPEAAGQVVQHYGALIEQGRFAEAASYWSDKGNAAAFEENLRSRGLKHLEIGDLSDPEGAAGSIYVKMEVVFYQGAKRIPAIVTLRRVNDVDGSTAAQRRWHIENIEWKS